MALYLDEQTRPYLERILKKTKDTDFIGKRLQKMLDADRERLQTISQCKHIPSSFIGHKTCCGHCGAFYEPGMGFSWEIQEEEQSHE